MWLLPTTKRHQGSGGMLPDASVSFPPGKGILSLLQPWKADWYIHGLLHLWILRSPFHGCPEEYSQLGIYDSETYSRTGISHIGVVAEDLDAVPFLITKDKRTTAIIGIKLELHVNHCDQSTDLLAKICRPTGQEQMVCVRQESPHHNLFNVWHRLSSVSGWKLSGI